MLNYDSYVKISDLQKLNIYYTKVKITFSVQWFVVTLKSIIPIKRKQLISQKAQFIWNLCVQLALFRVVMLK